LDLAKKKKDEKNQRTQLQGKKIREKHNSKGKDTDDGLLGPTPESGRVVKNLKIPKKRWSAGKKGHESTKKIQRAHLEYPRAQKKPGNKKDTSMDNGKQRRKMRRTGVSKEKYSRGREEGKGERTTPKKMDLSHLGERGIQDYPGVGAEPS